MGNEALESYGAPPIMHSHQRLQLCELCPDTSDQVRLQRAVIYSDFTFRTCMAVLYEAERDS